MLFRSYDLKNAENKYQHLCPYTKEGLHYRELFCKYYGNLNEVAKVIPYYWLPKWIEGATDPSARTLSIYKEVENNISSIPVNSSKSNYGAMSIPY